jgi:hypothetical protein
MGGLVRRTAVVAAVVASFAGSSAVRGAASETVIATGHWSGVSWRMSAIDYATGDYCVFMAVPATVTQPSESCGPLALKGGHAISYMAHTGKPRPDYIVGPVLATARLVEISLANGKALKAQTIAPRLGLAQSLRFYAEQLPCGVRVTRVLARDRRGRIVAQRSIPQLGPRNASC